MRRRVPCSRGPFAGCARGKKRLSDRFTPDSIDGDIEELLSPNANGDDARLTHALATLYAPPVEAGAALERVHARIS